MQMECVTSQSQIISTSFNDRNDFKWFEKWWFITRVYFICNQWEVSVNSAAYLYTKVRLITEYRQNTSKAFSNVFSTVKRLSQLTWSAESRCIIQEAWPRLPGLFSLCVHRDLGTCYKLGLINADNGLVSAILP